MSTLWILIIIYSANQYGRPNVSAPSEFTSLERCDGAGKALVGALKETWRSEARFICTEK